MQKFPGMGVDVFVKIQKKKENIIEGGGGGGGRVGVGYYVNAKIFGGGGGVGVDVFVKIKKKKIEGG